jgi:hypothetical protein
MITLLASFGLGLVPVALICLMALGQLEPRDRRRALRHPVLVARERLAADGNDPGPEDRP